ncbi:thiamine-phosphate kinase [Paraburkholderia sediminicola]|uniref:thiamine-phosphate kinase n=1 Tax=Paraburkholderia sediminicola TaxID=458836 RepID=UPI0038B71299
MQMNDIGEKSFLRSLIPSLKRADTFINGFGNDASVIDIGLPEISVAFKIDRAARPIAAYMGWAGFDTWGRLAVTANLSDILAVGALPTAFMLSVTVPGDWDPERVRSIILGAAEACDSKGVAFVGGDTKEGNEANVVGTAIGVINKKKVVSRRSANVGDSIVLAGRLGGFAGAYLLMKAGLVTKNSGYERCLSHPECAWDEAKFIFGSCAVTSAVDLSDGLSEGLQLLTSDQQGILLDLDQLPIHDWALKASKALNVNATNFAFTVGDWGMLFSMSDADAQRAVRLAPRGMPLSIIGTVVPQEAAGFYSGKTKARYKMNCELGNEHFRRRMENESDYFTQLVSTEVLSKI